VCTGKGCLIASDARVATRPPRTIADSALDHVRMMGDPGAMQQVIDIVADAQAKGETWHVTVLGSGAEACALSSTLVARGALVTQICEEKVIARVYIYMYIYMYVYIYLYIYTYT